MTAAPQSFSAQREAQRAYLLLEHGELAAARDVLDRADRRAPSLHRAAVPALVDRERPTLVDPIEDDERQVPAPRPSQEKDSGDPDPGKLQNDDGASLHFFGADRRSDGDDGPRRELMSPARRAWWSLSLATCW